MWLDVIKWVFYSDMMMIVFGCTGFALVKILRLNLKSTYANLFLVVAVGFFIVVTGNAIAITSANTVLFGVLLVGLFVWWDHAQNQKQIGGALQTDTFSLSFVVRALLEVTVVIVAIVVYRFSFSAEAFPWVEPVYNDYVFYAKVSHYLADIGSETAQLEYIFPHHYPSPYHYTDIWINSILLRCTNENAVTLMIFVSYTVGIAIVWLGFVALLESFHKVTSVQKVYSVLLLFASGFFLENIGGGSLIETSAVFSRHCLNYSKLFPNFIVLLGLCILFAKEKRNYILSLSLLLPVVNIATAPGVFIAIGLYLTYRLAWEKTLAKTDVIKAMILGVFLLAFYALKSEVGPTGDWSLKLDDYFTLTYMRTMMNIVAGTAIQFAILYLPLVCLLLVELFKKTKGSFEIVVIIAIAYFSFVLPWAALHQNPNSMQLFANFFVPFSSCALVFCGMYFQKAGSANKFLIAACIYLLPALSMAADVRERFKIRQRNNLVGDKRLIDFLVKTHNPLGAFLTNEYTWASKAPTFGSLDMPLQQFISRPSFHTVSLSVMETPLDSTSINFLYEKSLITNSTFGKYLRNETGRKNIFGLEKNVIESLQLKFLKENKITYLLTNYGYTIPDQLKRRLQEAGTYENLNLKVYSVTVSDTVR